MNINESSSAPIEAEQPQDMLRDFAEAACAVALALQAHPSGELDDDETTQTLLTMALGLGSVARYKRVRDQMIKQGWLLHLAKVDGMVLRLTSLGKENCEQMKKELESRMALSKQSQPEVVGETAQTPDPDQG